MRRNNNIKINITDITRIEVDVTNSGWGRKAYFGFSGVETSNSISRELFRYYYVALKVFCYAPVPKSIALPVEVLRKDRSLYHLFTY
jgi:hypothetical protein